MGREGPGMVPPGGRGPGGFAPGDLEFQTTWENYHWGLTFAEGFLTPAPAQGQPARTRAATGAAGAFDDDPFQEIRLSSPTPGSQAGNAGDANPARNQEGTRKRC